jgi:hypothetical protein
MDSSHPQCKSWMGAISAWREYLTVNTRYVVRFNVVTIMEDPVDSRSWNFVAGFENIANSHISHRIVLESWISSPAWLLRSKCPVAVLRDYSQN